MVTINQINEILLPALNITEDVDCSALNIDEDVDCSAAVIALLRKRIPFKEVNSIIYGVDHEVIYLCTVDEVAPYLTEEDLRVLAYLGCELDDEEGYRLTIWG